MSVLTNQTTNDEVRGLSTAVADLLDLSLPRACALVIAILCLLSLIDGLLPQVQLFFFGQIYIREYAIKGFLGISVGISCVLFSSKHLKTAPKLIWLVCVGYLLLDIAHLITTRGMTLGDVLKSYAIYYAQLLIGPALLMFRGTVPERLITRCTVILLLICAVIGLAQYVEAQPLLYTESAEGTFRVESWSFFDEVRAFSLFTSSLNYGVFCALCGALGVSLLRKSPSRGVAVTLISAVACLTTLTRLSYLLFMCACTYALVLTFGRRPSRGLWHPLAYFGAGIGTIIYGVGSVVNGRVAGLRDAGSLLERIGQWTYYSDFLVHSGLIDQLFGFGIVQNETIRPLYPVLIDNLPLALILHIGFIGLLLFGILLTKMWLYLRREAVSTQQPFMIAAASLWAALTCAGIFNIVLASLGTVFCLAILCRSEVRCDR